jgi:hypothetical protein
MAAIAEVANSMLLAFHPTSIVAPPVRPKLDNSSPYHLPFAFSLPFVKITIIKHTIVHLKFSFAMFQIIVKISFINSTILESINSLK